MEEFEFDFTGYSPEEVSQVPKRVQNENAFYAAAFSNGGEEAYDAVKAQYTLEGESELYTQTQDLLNANETLEYQETVKNIIEDPEISLQDKRAVMQQYAITGDISMSLRDKYIQKTAVDSEQNQELSDDTFGKMYADKVEQANNSEDAQVGVLSALLTGTARTLFGAGRTFGLVSDEDYELLIKESDPIVEENPIATAVGGMVPLFAGAITGSIPAAAVIGATISGTDKYSQLGLSKIDQETRLVASLANAGVTTAMLATPIFKAATILKAMALNGAAFVTLGELDRNIQNTVLEGYPELQRNLDWTHITIEGAMGMAFGALLGRKNPAIAMEGPTVKSPSDVAPVVKEGPDPLPNLKVDDTTPLGVTALHDEEKAATLGAGILLEKNKKISDGTGASQAEVLATHFLDQTSSELKGYPSGIVDRIDTFMKQGVRDFERTQTSAILWDKKTWDSLGHKVDKTINEFSSSSLHQSKSSRRTTPEGTVKGTATFGKTPDTAFTSYEEATKVLGDFEKKLAHGELALSKLDPKTNTLKPVTKPDPQDGLYYVQWHYEVEPWELGGRIFGDDAVNVSLNIPFYNKPSKVIDKALTTLARTPVVNRAFLPGTHFLPRWLTMGASVAEDTFISLEKPIIGELTNAVAALKRISGETVIYKDLLLRGSEEGKVFSYGEISAMSHAKGISETGVNRIARAYYLDRRIDDLQYLFYNRHRRQALKESGMVQYDFGGKPVFAKPIAESAGVKETHVWAEESESIVELSAKEIAELYSAGGTIARMDTRINIGNEYTNHILIPSGTKKGELPPFVLNRLTGHSPRGWESYYFVDAEPINPRMNGKLVVDPEVLRTFRKARGIAETKKEADALVAELAKKHPEYKWTMRRDKVDVESLVEEYRIHTDMTGRSAHRGETLVDSGGTATPKDPFVSRINSINNAMRTAAFAPWMKEFQDGFVKSYGKFLRRDPNTGEVAFPAKADDIIKPSHMSEGGASNEKKHFDDALVHFLYYKSIVESGTLTGTAWKKGLYFLGEHSETLSKDLAKTLRWGGRHSNPVHVLKSMSTAFMIYLNPTRQFVLQSAQMMQYMMARPEYFLSLKPESFLNEYLSLIWGSAMIPHSGIMSTLTKFKWQKKIAYQLGSKISNKDPDAYAALLRDFQESGLAYTDTNLVVDGMLGEGHRNLVEGVGEAAAQTTLSAAKAIPNIGKAVGFAPGEGNNLMGAWLAARHRYKGANPKANLNTPEARANILANARSMAGELNQAGAMVWSRGILSLPLQFIQVPWKLFINLLTSKVWTPQEKSRMLAGNLALFGAGAVYLGEAIDALREEVGDVIPSEAWMGIKGGFMDLSVDQLIRAGLDEDEKKVHSPLAISESFSPLGNALYLSGLLTTIQDDSFSKILLGPSWSLFNSKTGRIPTALKDIAGYWQKDDLEGAEATKMSMIRAFQATSGGTNWMKMQVAMETGKVVAASGRNTGLQATWLTSTAKLFGVQTYAEVGQRMLSQKDWDEKKEVRAAIKYMIGEVERSAALYGNDKDPFYKSQALFNSMTTWITKNPDLEFKMRAEFTRAMNELAKDEGRNAFTDMYKSAQALSGEDLNKRTNFLSTSGDPQMEALGKTLEEERKQIEGLK